MPIDKTLIDHIRNMVCQVHGIHPIVEDDWDGIKIDCCCGDFHKECLKEVEKANLKTAS